jgi:hypothetical protein
LIFSNTTFLHFLVRYQLVVTQRKEEEPQSSSIYYQNDIWNPSTAFADFINNETLLGEVGSSNNRGEGLLYAWHSGCPASGHRMEGMISSSELGAKEFSYVQHRSYVLWSD